MLLNDKKYIALFLSPALLLIGIFLYYPLGLTFYYSFTDWHQFSPVKNWVGLANYQRFFHDPVVLTGLLNTLKLIGLCLIFEVAVALILALMLDSVRRGYKFFRMVFFFPVVISGAAIGLMFLLAYQYDYGLLNTVLGWFGIEKQVWITEKTSALLTAIPVMWQMVGFYLVIFLTAISKVPQDIYESAMLDGITGVRKATAITIPMIWDVIAISVGLVITGATKVFDIVFTITGGGPLDSSQLLSTYMYQSAFISNNQGYGSTIAVSMVILGVGLTVLTTRLTKREIV